MTAKRVGLDTETIVQKAAELADNSGLDDLSMATLAAHLGVRTPALYHYFAGLAGLRRALALRGLHQVSAQVGHAVMGKAGDDAVLALAHALRDYAKEHPGLYSAASRAPDQTDPEWRVAGEEAVGIVLRALSAYHLSPEDALHAVRMVRSIVHGIVVLENAGGFGLPLEVDETFRRLLASFLMYLHSSGAGQEG
jgi:AcrR family transcriptional regulator